MTLRLPESVLLDRDGTINVKAGDGQYVTRPDQLNLLPGAAQGIRALNLAGVPVVVVTNQRGIALGRMTEDDLAAVHSRLEDLLGQHAAHIDGIFYCPHDKGVCACRKPGTMLLKRAQTHLKLASLRNSVMVGDSPSDVLAGRTAGARTLLIGRPNALTLAGVKVTTSLQEAVRLILGL